jgi:phosphohistidine swiveling domain-containing protein
MDVTIVSHNAGITSGNAVFSLHDAKVLHDSNISSILILDKCCLPGESVTVGADPLSVALGEGGLGVSGLLVLQGGVTSPLIELARSQGIPVISGASKSGLFLDNYSTRSSPCIRRKSATSYSTSAVSSASTCMEAHPLSNTTMVISQYQEITLDGSSGRVFQGVVPAVSIGMDFCDLLCMRWVDQCRRLR